MFCCGCVLDRLLVLADLISAEPPPGMRIVLVSRAWPLGFESSRTLCKCRPRSSIVPDPMIKRPLLMAFVTHAVTLVVLPAIMILNVISPEQYKGCPSASVFPTRPGYVIICATPKRFSTSSDTINFVLDMSKRAFHSKALLPVEALGIIWTTGGISNLLVRLSGWA